MNQIEHWSHQQHPLLLRKDEQQGEPTSFAHVRCVMSEIIKVLKGDLRNMVLKTIGSNLWNLSEEVVLPTEKELAKSSMTFKDLLNSVGDEVGWFTSDFTWETSSHKETSSSHEEEVSQSTADQLNLRDDYIDELKRNFYKRSLKINSADLAMKVIDFEGYKVPFTVAPVLKVLLRKYKDICVDSERSLEVKSIALSFLCKVVKQMHSTRIQDITKDLLQNWYFYVEFADYRVKLEVNFLKQYLQITRAFFGFQLKKVEEDVPTIISKKIDELKHKLQECQKFRQTSPKPKFVSECMDEAEKLKWKTLISEI